MAPSFPDNVRLIPAMPSDFHVPEFKARYKQALLSELLPTGSAKIYTHDLMYQESFLPIAEAIHEIGDIQAFEWFHLIHSGLPRVRPLDQVARCTVPPNHNIVVLNRTEIGTAAGYYQTKNIRVWSNQVGVTDLYPFSEDGLKLARKIPMDADVVSVIPADANRLMDKGLDLIIEVHNALQKIGLKTCLVVVDSYNNREDYYPRRDEFKKSYHTDNGSILFMSVEAGCVQILRSDVFGLMTMADVFIFPSVAESSSLAIQEAALAKNILVLNSSVPQMAEQIPHEMALYYPFGGVRYAQRNIDYDKIASDIHLRLLESDVTKTKQKVARHSDVVPV